MSAKRLDITGQTFGRLTAIRFVERKQRRCLWEFECACGVRKVIGASDVKRGNTNSCGCSRRKDITGQTFGRLTAIRFVKVPGDCTWWEFKCTCGVRKIIRTHSVKNGDITSCGCRMQGQFEARHTQKKPTYSAYQRRAKYRRIPFNLTNEQFDDLISRPCSYCGAPPWNGIDRVDSSRGYGVGNAYPCCHYCNRMKSSLSPKEFGQHIRKIVTAHPEIIEGLYPLQDCKGPERMVIGA